MIRLTVRATDDSVAPILLKYMQERLSSGMSEMRVQRPTHEGISEAFGNVMVK